MGDWWWGNNSPNPNPHKSIPLTIFILFFLTHQYTTLILAYGNSFGHFSWNFNLVPSLFTRHTLSYIGVWFYQKSSQNLKGNSSSVQCALCYSQQKGKKKRQRKQRCRETSAISCHTKGCQVLFIYIDDLMMIVWYLKLLPPTRDALKLLSICLFCYLFDCKNAEIIGKKIACCQSPKKK